MLVKSSIVNKTFSFMWMPRSSQWHKMKRMDQWHALYENPYFFVTTGPNRTSLHWLVIDKYLHSAKKKSKFPFWHF